MAKVPEFPRDNRPSAVGGALPSVEAVTAPLELASRFGQAAFEVASKEELDEAKRLRAALEAKQDIVNEVEAGQVAGDFEEQLADASTKLQEQFQKTPEKAPEELLKLARAEAERRRDAASNDTVGLAIAQRTNARINSAMRKMHTWVQARQTQKAKTGLAITVNRATASAERLTTTGELAALIANKEAELSGVFTRVFGKDAPRRMSEMKSGMAQAWTLSASDRDPVGTLVALDAKEGPLVDHLDVKQRERLRKDAQSSFAGSMRAQELEVIKDGMTTNKDMYDAFLDGSLDSATIFARQQALEQQRKAVGAQLELDIQTMEQLGVKTQFLTPKEIDEQLASQLRFVNALDTARRRQIAFDAPENPASEAAILEQVDKALRDAKKGKDMAEIVKQQERLAIALGDGKIRGSRASTMFKTMALTIDTAAKNQEDVWGPNTWRMFRAPREMGIVELNNQFAGPLRQLSKESQIRIRFDYEDQFNSAIEAGQVVTAQDARRMALRSIALETGTTLPGVR